MTIRKAVAACTLIFSLFAVAAGDQRGGTHAEAPESASDIQPLLVGATIPAVTLKDMEGNPFDLREAVSKKPTVLVFYRGGWCPYCMKHLNSLAQTRSELEKMGYQMIAVSQDTPELTAKTVKKHKLGFTVLSDTAMEATRAFGVCFKVDAATVEKYKGYNIDLVGLYGRQQPLMPVPAVTIIGTDQKIRFNYVNPDYSIRLAPEVVVAAAKSFL